MLNFIKDILFPRECLFCKKYGSWLCADCAASIKPSAGQSCPQCKRLNSWGELCPDCRGDFIFSGIWVAGDYSEQKLSTLIKTYKYNFLKDLGPVLSDFIYNFLQQKIFINPYKNIFNATLKIRQNNTLLIPVPLSRQRQRWRGFNQAELLAERLAQSTGLSLNKDLKRIRHCRPQAQLDGKQRLHNLSNAFKWTGETLIGQKIILVDDVATTGTTINECAKVLRAAGAGDIWGLVLAGKQ